MNTKKLSTVNSVTTLESSDYVNVILSNGELGKISRAYFATAMADAMRIATANNNGLMPAYWFGMERRTQTTVHRFIYQAGPGVNGATSPAIATSLLISISQSGGAQPSIYTLTINRVSSKYDMPAFELRQIAGLKNTTPHLKVWNDDTTGLFKLYYERTNYTPALYVKIMNTVRATTDSLDFTEAKQEDIDSATDIPVTT